MQEQRGVIDSFPETLGFENGSTSIEMVDQQIYKNSQSNQILDYISLDSPEHEEQNENMWNIGEPSSGVGPSPSEPRPDRGWSSMMKSCLEPPSSVLSLHDHGSSSSSDPFDLDDQRLSHKRKAVELSNGQSSSGVGSSSTFQRAETGSSSWHTISENPSFDPTIPRLGLNVTASPSENQQLQDLLLPNNNNRDQPVIRVPSLRRNFQSNSRLTRSSGSRGARSSNLVISGDRNELDSISDHPLFAAPSNIRDDVQSELDRPRRLSSYLRRSLSSAADSEVDGRQNDNRVSRIPDFGTSSSSSSSQDISVPPAVAIQDHNHHHHHQSQSRSSLLLARHLDGVFRFPPHSRSVTPGSEGRGRLVSEVRNVLDLMRRGEPLRVEDLMLLDQSVFNGIADIHDRHRDMMLDIDNMSYEELLALEERIGNVNTGLTEETILKHLKHKQYVHETGLTPEPCCICQEEYKDGDDLGMIECGHDFHPGCIKQWLQHKNSCPICKSTGFSNT